MAQFFVLALALLAGSCYASGQSRIVGGEVTTSEQFPRLVQIETYSIISGSWSHSCGANILTERFILSAAHCFFILPAIIFRIRAGATYRNEGGVTHTIRSITNHPDFLRDVVEKGLDSDISLLRLQLPLTFSNVIQPATIVSQGFVVPDNAPVTYAGWGMLAHASNDGQISDVLRYVNTYTVNRDECQLPYNEMDFPLPVTENMICAAYPDTTVNKGICQGDSGGPMYYQGFLVGIVSWGENCGNATWPGVTTRVASFTDWIVATAV